MLNKIMTINQQRAVKLNKIGLIVFYQNKLYEESIKYFNKAIAIEHTYAAAYRNRASAKYHLGDTIGFLNDITIHDRLDPYGEEHYLGITREIKN